MNKKFIKYLFTLLIFLTYSPQASEERDDSFQEHWKKERFFNIPSHKESPYPKEGKKWNKRNRQKEKDEKEQLPKD